MRRGRWWWMAVAAGVLAAGGSDGQPARGRSEEEVSRSFASRLEALDPARPEMYFELAEEVAEWGAESGARSLAIRLYVLAFELDRARGGRGGVAASSALGLAAATGNGRDRAWALALARVMDPRQAEASWARMAEPASVESFAYRLATAVGEARSGDSRGAKRLLSDPDVSGALERFDAVMRRLGMSGGAPEVRRWAERGVCAVCAGERVVKVGRGPGEVAVCPQCGGVPAPRLGEEELTGSLRFESWLLQGKPRTWASQLSVDGGVPLLDPVPEELARTYGVDAGKAVWRAGRWVEAGATVGRTEETP